MEILNSVNNVSVCFRLLFSCILGGMIGLERGRHGRAAGLRTHILVCMGACMTALVSSFVAEHTELDGDVFRISAQVISGIGFLGAGTILVKNQSVVMGLTTAAGVWCTAAIGLGAGYGFYFGALLAAAICMLTTGLLTLFEIRNKRTAYLYAEITETKYVTAAIQTVKELIPEVRIDIVPAKSMIAGALGLHIVLRKLPDDALMEKLTSIEGIAFLAEEHI